MDTPEEIPVKEFECPSCGDLRLLRESELDLSQPPLCVHCEIPMRQVESVQLELNLFRME